MDFPACRPRFDKYHAYAATLHSPLEQNRTAQNKIDVLLTLRSLTLWSSREVKCMKENVLDTHAVFKKATSIVNQAGRALSSELCAAG